LFSEALQQAMVRLGHPNMPDDALTLEALTASCDIEHLSTSSVRWSNDEMWRWHTKRLHATPASELAPLLVSALNKQGLTLAEMQAVDFAEIMAGNLNKIEDVLLFARLLDSTSCSDDAKAAVEESGREFFEQAKQTWLNLEQADWKAWTSSLKEVSGKKGKALFLPLRFALSGQAHGPEMSRVVAFLGKDGVEQRLDDVLGRL